MKKIQLLNYVVNIYIPPPHSALLTMNILEVPPAFTDQYSFIVMEVTIKEELPDSTPSLPLMQHFQSKLKLHCNLDTDLPNTFTVTRILS